MSISLERKSAQEPQPASSLPTDLNLLHFRTPALDGTRISIFRTTLDTSTKLGHDYQQVGIFLGNLFDERDKRLARVNGAEKGLSEEGENIFSSSVLSNVYLKMKEAFPQMPFSDFIIVFNTSVEVSIKSY